METVPTHLAARQLWMQVYAAESVQKPRNRNAGYAGYDEGTKSGVRQGMAGYVGSTWLDRLGQRFWDVALIYSQRLDDLGRPYVAFQRRTTHRHGCCWVVYRRDF
jgi:hypothetical protein